MRFRDAALDDGRADGARAVERLPAPEPVLARLRRAAAPRIAVFRALKLGDLLVAVPALRALRRALPRAHVTLVALPWARAFTDRFPHYLDAFVAFPGFPGLPDVAPDPQALPAFLGAVHERRFDLAIQMHGSGRLSNPVVACFGARAVAGFTTEGAWCPDGMAAYPWPEVESEVWRLLRLVHALGGPEDDGALEFPVHDADRARLAPLLGDAQAPEARLAVLHPGASVPRRRWPEAHFAAVGQTLLARGCTVVLTGTESEHDVTARVHAELGEAVIDLTGRTDIGQLAALLERAALLVCNDTGPSHLAAALRTPSVVCSTPPDVNGWAPLDHTLHRTLYSPFGVSVEAVLRHADELLTDPTASRPNLSP